MATYSRSRWLTPPDDLHTRAMWIRQYARLIARATVRKQVQPRQDSVAPDWMHDQAPAVCGASFWELVDSFETMEQPMSTPQNAPRPNTAIIVAAIGLVFIGLAQSLDVMDRGFVGVAITFALVTIGINGVRQSHKAHAAPTWLLVVAALFMLLIGVLSLRSYF